MNSSSSPVISPSSAAFRTSPRRRPGPRRRSMLDRRSALPRRRSERASSRRFSGCELGSGMPGTSTRTGLSLTSMEYAQRRPRAWPIYRYRKRVTVTATVAHPSFRRRPRRSHHAGRFPTTLGPARRRTAVPVAGYAAASNPSRPTASYGSAIFGSPIPTWGRRYCPTRECRSTDGDSLARLGVRRGLRIE